MAAFQTDDAVGQCILLLFGYVFADYLCKVGQGHDGTADHEVLFALLFLATKMAGLAVFQSDGVADLLSHTDFLARAVDELKLAFGKQDSQRNAWEAAASAEVENACAGAEVYHPGNGHRVEHVVLVEVVDVLARDDVDFGVPVAIQLVEQSNLVLLLCRQLWKIFLYNIHLEDNR